MPTISRHAPLSLCIAAATLLAIAQPAAAQVLATVGKQHRTVQSDATTLSGASSMGGAWRFSASVDGSATGSISFTPPGGTPQSLPLTAGVYTLANYYSSQSLLNTAYPNGSYTLSYNGKNVPISLTGDTFPSQPLANPSVGTWSNGSLYVSPSQAVTITYLFGANYLSGSARMTASVSGVGYSDNEAAPDFTHTQWSITIPASAMLAGAVFNVTLDSDNVAAEDTTSVPGFTNASYYEAETGFNVIVGTAPVTGQPMFTSMPNSVTIASGSTLTLSASASGTPVPTYQWMFNKTAITGATGPRLLIPGITIAQGGTYVCVATNTAGTSNSSPATVTVITTTNPGRLVNLSVLSQVQGLLTTGFVTGGAGTSGPETLLLRGIGPALATFGEMGVLPDPTISLIPSGSSTATASNAGWGTPASNVAIINAADSATGAFALSNTASADSAMVQMLSSGGYSVQMKGKSGDSGLALTEVYDDTANYAPASTRLINVSCLTPVATGGMLTAGFVVGGSSAKTVLIRGSGPSLAALGVPSVMPDPQVAVYASGTSTPIAFNAGWQGDVQIATVGAQVGAFAFSSPTSKDSAVLLTLMPGDYSAQVSSVAGSGGTTLVEVYEVP